MTAMEHAARLSCWSGPVDPVPLAGGITNTNFLVEDAGHRFVVRIGEDIPIHQVMRFNELAASKAAHAVGISPAVHYHEPGALVLEFIEGRTLTEEDVGSQNTLDRIVPVIRACHREIPKFIRGPVLVFWVFHVLRDYAATLKQGNSTHMDALPRLMAIADELESETGPIDLVFGHNDLLAGNFIDDGRRIWLIDWDYAGFNSPLFDLGGLASNNALSPDQQDWLIETYFERPLDDGLRRRYEAMKCASLLREAMWSMVSEIHSAINFDYSQYTAENLGRFETAWTAFQNR